MKFLQLLLFCCLSACVTVSDSEVLTTDEYTLRKVILPQIQIAVDKMYADEYAAALPILDALIAGDYGALTPYEMATVLELRAASKTSLDDCAGAKADLEAAYALDAFPPDRRAMLRDWLDRLMRER